MRHVGTSRLAGSSQPDPRVPRQRGVLANEIRAAVAVGGGLIRAGADALLNHIPATTTQPPPSYAHDPGPQPNELEHLTALVYELLDAHHDTAVLAADLTHDPFWHAHLEYLRALQRQGREVLAVITHSNE